jgi:hypothetical protein
MSPMRRVHLIEIHEQRWFPAELRTTVTDLLQFILNLTGYHRIVAPVLRAALDKARTNHVVDLCSGSGGPWPGLLQEISADKQISICLTDKYPDHTAFEKVRSASPRQVTFALEPVDAERVPRTLLGCRTLFNSFHHFSHEHAQHVLADAMDKGQAVAIFEVPRRRPVALFATGLMALGTLFFVPFVRRFRFSLFVWTYLIPVVPFVMWFDGVVSCLRAHSMSELRHLTSGASMCSYDWSFGNVRGPNCPVPVTFLVGCPQPVGDGGISAPRRYS